MKFLIVFIFSVFTFFQSLNLDLVRDQYKNAAKDAVNIDAFFYELTRVTKNDRIELVAYKGASIALKAKIGKTIQEKKDGFIKGVGFVEYAVEKAPNNIEVRFVRLSIQQNTPKLLQYYKNIEADKQFILQHYNTIKSTSLKRVIADYISNAKGFTDQEKSLILKP